MKKQKQNKKRFFHLAQYPQQTGSDEPKFRRMKRAEFFSSSGNPKNPNLWGKSKLPNWTYWSYPCIMIARRAYCVDWFPKSLCVCPFVRASVRCPSVRPDLFRSHSEHRKWSYQRDMVKKEDQNGSQSVKSLALNFAPISWKIIRNEITYRTSQILHCPQPMPFGRPCPAGLI